MASTISRKRSVQDFQFGNRIGEGSYSTVYKATDLQSKKIYAIKVLSKKHIVKEKKIKYVNIEKTTLNRLGRHPGVVTLYYTFQDENSLYFVIDMAEYGELLTIIRKLGSLSEECSKFYMIQIIDAVDFMHKKGIIHRDLKPENILVNSDMKLMITDFGAAKVLDLDPNGNIIENVATEESFAKGSFVGTAEYVSPELLKYNKCGFECDIWAIGCILYQFLVGIPPFKGKTEYLTFEKIVNLQYQWPNFYIPPTIKDLVDSLLRSNPHDRLTIPQIQQHKWFGNFNWEDKSRIWTSIPPKLEPYQPIIQQHNENTQHLKKIVIQKKVPAATAKKQLLSNTLKQIKNENGSYVYGSGLGNGIERPKFQQPPPTVQTNYRPISPAQTFTPPQPPAFNSSSPRSRSPGSPQARPQGGPQAPPSQQQQQIPRIPTQQMYSPQKVQPPRQIPQEQYQQRQSPQSSQPIQQNNFNKPKPIPQFVQSIKQQAPPQIKSQPQPPQQQAPKLAPPLVPISSQVKPQTLKQQPSQQQVFQQQQYQRPLAQPPRPQAQAQRSTPTQSPKASGGSPVKSQPGFTQQARNGSSPVVTTSSPKKSPSKPTKNGVVKIPVEIGAKLAQGENVIKLDYINQSELVYSSLFTFDPTSALSGLRKNAGLDDVSINEIITRNESQLKKDVKRVVMLITDFGNLYLFHNSTLGKFDFYIKIDLTDKMFAMYDYEFSEFGESGYLILELPNVDRLIFLAPLSKDVKSDLEEVSDAHIGLELSWIEALLKTKELLKTKPSSPATTTTSQPMTKSSSSTGLSGTGTGSTTTTTSSPMKKTKSTPTITSNNTSSTTTATTTTTKAKTVNGVVATNGTKTMTKTTKPPQSKPPRRPTSATSPPPLSKPITTQQQIQQQNRKFAGGAAAAAFNASR